ncbi:hypothetical protein ACJIZ3_014771 [Penstemon smallii]|uniref:Uncharacterized protein n=1 Tax=Penstemon smallii TaxID=265156 RepID=A0ABD3RKS9_9LAMI
MWTTLHAGIMRERENRPCLLLVMHCRLFPTQIYEHQTLRSSSISFLKNSLLPFFQHIIYSSDTTTHNFL